MNILVIGGTGLVGSYLLPQLVKSGHEVFALTRATSKIDKLQEIGARDILGDILEPQAFLKELPEKPDFIILLAMPGITPGKRIGKPEIIQLIYGRIYGNGGLFRSSTPTMRPMLL